MTGMGLQFGNLRVQKTTPVSPRLEGETQPKVVRLNCRWIVQWTTWLVKKARKIGVFFVFCITVFEVNDGLGWRVRKKAYR